MDKIIDIVLSSLKDLLSDAIKVFPGFLADPRQPKVRQIQTRAIIAIKDALDDANIGIPYPIRTLYFYNQDKYKDHIPNNSNNNSNGDRVNLDSKLN